MLSVGLGTRWHPSLGVCQRPDVRFLTGSGISLGDALDQVACVLSRLAEAVGRSRFQSAERHLRAGPERDRRVVDNAPVGVYRPDAGVAVLVPGDDGGVGSHLTGDLARHPGERLDSGGSALVRFVLPALPVEFAPEPVRVVYGRGAAVRELGDAFGALATDGTVGDDEAVGGENGSIARLEGDDRRHVWVLARTRENGPAVPVAPSTPTSNPEEMPSRRDVLMTLGVGAAVGLAGCADDAPPAEPDALQWPQSGGGPRNAAVAPDHTVPAAVGERWRTPIVPDGDLLAFAGGVVDEGQVVAAGRIREGGFCNRFSLRDGDAERGRSIPRAIAAPPVSVGGGIALVYTSDGSAELHVLDDEDRSHSFTGPIPPAPRAADGVLFAGDAGGAFAYDVAADDRRWHRAFGDDRESGEIPFTPAVDDEAVYVTVTNSADCGVYALDRQTGEVLWSVEGPRAVRGPARVGSLLLVPVQYELLALDAATGERRWSTPTPPDRRAFHAPVGTNRTLAVSDGIALHRMDPDTGELGWHVEYEQVGRPVVIGDTAIASTGSGVVAHDLADGSERWRVAESSLVAPLGNGVLVRAAGDLAAYTAAEN